MEARAHPRSSLQIKTDLVCPSTQTMYARYVRNISLGGLYVSGTPCATTGSELAVIMTPLGHAESDATRFPAKIARTASSGFALRFDPMSDRDSRILGDLINPSWDGKNVIEGLLIVAAREHVMSLSECLRLTSVVCNRYRRICTSHNCKSGSRNTPPENRRRPWTGT